MTIRSSITAKLIAAFLLTFLVSGCMEKTSENPDEVYKYWAGRQPGNDVKIIHGKYWESAHWTKEYIMFMELKASKEWIEVYVKQNNLVLDDVADSLTNDSPEWFKPTKDFMVFRQKDKASNSRYYINLKEDRMFIFERQF